MTATDKGSDFNSENDAPTDLEPVELDPLDPAIVRWRELADRDIDVYHGGDAEKVIPFPRPAWADADQDFIGRSLTGCYYNSEWVNVVTSHALGNVDSEVSERASVKVRAKQCGDGEAYVGITVRRCVDGKWVEIGTNMLAAEVTDLIAVLQASVDLIGGAQG
jgi:hypothetical protein